MCICGEARRVTPPVGVRFNIFFVVFLYFNLISFGLSELVAVAHHHLLFDVMHLHKSP